MRCLNELGFSVGSGRCPPLELIFAPVGSEAEVQHGMSRRQTNLAGVWPPGHFC
jgi:hypothetical protein